MSKVLSKIKKKQVEISQLEKDPRADEEPLASSKAKSALLKEISADSSIFSFHNKTPGSVARKTSWTLDAERI